MKKQSILNKVGIVSLWMGAMGMEPVFADTTVWTVELRNTLASDRADVPVVLALNKLPFAAKSALVTLNGETVPSQLDDLNQDNRKDELAFVIDLKGRERKTVKVTFSSDERFVRTYPLRTYGDMIIRDTKNKVKNAYRTYVQSLTVPGSVNPFALVHHHGVDFESELTAYRIYFDSRQTVDLYGKYEKRLELEKTQFYPDEAQLAARYGDDILWVGSTVGLGTLRGWDGQKPTLIEPVALRGQSLLATGPVRTVAEVKNVGWKYAGKELNMTTRYTIYAGHRDAEVNISFDEPVKGVPFTTGVINLKGTSFSDHKGLVGDWGENWPNGASDSIAGKPKQVVGLAVNLPQSVVKEEVKQNAEQYLYIIDPQEKQRFTYHIAFVSGKENAGLSSAGQWFAWMKRWKTEIEHPITIDIK